MAEEKITALFLDIGGVLLTNGWDRDARARAIEEFDLDEKEISDRHELVFSTYELGKLNMDDYLNYVVFNKNRKFSREEFKSFMYGQSEPLPEDSLSFFAKIKAKHKLKVIAVSNEVRELNDFRIKKFGLNNLFDAFLSSCYVGLRKPDPDLFRLACDSSQTKPQHALFIDDRLPYVEIARSLSLNGLHYTGIEAAKKDMEKYNL